MIELDFSVECPDKVLSGTLCLPSNNGAFPCILMLPGSGPIDRNENIDGQSLNIFNSIAHFLAGAGFASFRYDKRGCGRSTGVFFQAGYFDFVDDAVVIFDSLKRHRHCLPDQIFALGHSEGAVTAMHLQINRKDVAGIIQLCPTTDNFEVALIKQAEHVRDVTSGALNGSDPVAAQMQLIARVKNGEAYPREVEAYQIGLKWLREVLALDVKHIFSQVTCRMLLIAGEKDVQCDSTNISAIRSPTGTPLEIQVVPNLTHILRLDPEPASILHYPALMEEPIDPAVMDRISHWLLSQDART